MMAITLVTSLLVFQVRVDDHPGFAGGLPGLHLLHPHLAGLSLLGPPGKLHG